MTALPRSAILLAGGLGTRLDPITRHRPKGLIPVGRCTILEIQLAWLRAQGVEQVVLAVSHMADRIQRALGNGSRFGIELQYADEETPLGTGGATRNAAALLPHGPVLVVNGDLLLDTDLTPIADLHVKIGAEATIGLVAAQRPHGFGVIGLEADGRVAWWREPTDTEKRRAALQVAVSNADWDLVNAGVYLLEPEAIARAASAGPVSLERTVLPEVIRSRSGMAAAALVGYWRDIGSPASLLAASRDLASGRIQTRCPALVRDAEQTEGADVDMQTLLGEGAIVEAGAVVRASMLLENSRVGAGAVVENAIIDAGAVVMPGSHFGSDQEAAPACLAAGEQFPAPQSP
ncbi:MAG: NDP-sugar synthase [Armatimonadetes bacterium]|nr:NDP-sugar synthase [Armatimonadota bacterium]MDE2205567.1 NDP-sugar synthase [Armatimonadota bacterium]